MLGDYLLNFHLKRTCRIFCVYENWGFVWHRLVRVRHSR